jgi:hypothetical protein
MNLPSGTTMRRTIAPVLVAAALMSCQMPTAEDFARNCEAQGLARNTSEFTACVQRAQAAQARRSATPSAPPSSYGY